MTPNLHLHTDASIKQASWDSANIGVRFYQDIDSHVTDVRTAKLSELTTRYKVNIFCWTADEAVLTLCLLSLNWVQIKIV